MNGFDHVSLAADNYASHNAEVKECWQAYWDRKPYRVPISWGINPRLWLLDPALNTRGITFREYFSDVETMMRVQVWHQDYVRHSVVQDAEMGLPEAWNVYPDFQNCYEALWFGCELHFFEDNVPDTVPMLAGDKKNLLFDRGIPDPLGGVMATNIERREYLRQRRAEGFEHRGRPLAEPGLSMGGSDGIFTAACNLRGTTQACLDLYEDPDYARSLLDFITEATIVRLRAWRKLTGTELRTKGMGLADDAIALLSTEMYREFVLPCHRRMLSELTEGGPNSMHLCGDATRHFPLLRDELNIQSFDTGFPVDFAWLREALGPDVEIHGGPHVDLLQRGTPEEVAAETRRILESGVMRGGRFHLREGNNLAPRTPLANIEACYRAGREWGRY